MAARCSRYREVLCVDALESCFVELEEGFVKYCGAMLRHAASGDGGWETAEVVLFATRGAAVRIKQFLRARDASDPMLKEHQEDVTMFLHALFAAIASHAPVVTDHFAVMQSGARCIQMFTSWVAKQSTLINGIVGYTLKGLKLAPTAESVLTLVLWLSRHTRGWLTLSALCAGMQASPWPPSVQGARPCYPRLPT